MESDDIRATLREADRAAAAPWIDYPPTPRWWAPLFGIWTLLFGLNIGYVDHLAQAVGSLVLALSMGALVGWQRSIRGTYPTGRAPREFRASMTVLFVGALVLGAIGWLVATLSAPWVGAVVAAIGAVVLVAWYERTYARVAAELRARLR